MQDSPMYMARVVLRSGATVTVQAPTFACLGDVLALISSPAESSAPSVPEVSAAATGPAAEPDAKPTTTTASYDDVKSAIVSLVRASGVDAARAALQKFGAKHASDLPDSEYQAFIDHASRLPAGSGS